MTEQLRSANFPTGSPDFEIADSVRREIERQRNNLVLVASENFVSPAVRAAVGSVFMNKFSEGYPGARYCAGCEEVDVVEGIAIDRAKRLFSADHANVQPHSGSQANMAAYRAVLEAGDTVLAMGLTHGGHLTHGAQVNESGRTYRFVHYGVRSDTHLIDYDQVRDLARQERPRLIVAGATAYPRQIDFAAFASIADEVGAVFMADVAQYSGLIAGGAYESPVRPADIVTSSTYKVLRGPRGGMILCSEQFAKEVDRSLFPAVQGGPHSNVVAAKAICFHEASAPTFADYAHDVVKAGRELAASLEGAGLAVVTRGTDSHIVLVDLSRQPVTGRQAERRLSGVGIVSNRNLVPFDKRPASVTSGVRFGTAAMVTGGLFPKEFGKVGELIARALRAEDGSPAGAKVAREVRELVHEVRARSGRNGEA